MGFKTRDNGKENNKQSYAKFDMAATEAIVQNVRVVTDDLITFTLRCQGFSLYNMKLVNGKNGYFITPPSIKSSNGAYYNQYAIYLSEEDTKDLIDSVLVAAGVKEAK